MSEEKKIFDRKFVHFMWSDELQGKEGFYSDSIEYLIMYVEVNATEHKRCAKRNCQNNSYPFSILFDGDSDSFKFFYYDPLYDVKLAWKNGKQIQSRSKVCICDGWRDDDYPNWNNSCEEFRVKPEKKWRPFKDIAELKQTWLAKNGAKSKGDLYEPFIWVRDKKHPDITRLITGFNADCNCVALAGQWHILEGLFDEYEFLDGTPCGVKE